MKKRHVVLGLLAALSVITFIDRMVDRLTTEVGPYAHTIDRLIPLEQADFV